MNINSLITCRTCKIERNESDYHKQIANKTGLNYTCKFCIRERTKNWQKNNKERKAISARRYRTKDKNRIKNVHLKCQYGITLADYNEMKISQNNKCLICNREVKLVVDHCHTSGKVRGLLCYRCNSALGSFKDSVNILNNAIKYLNKNNEKT